MTEITLLCAHTHTLYRVCDAKLLIVFAATIGDFWTLIKIVKVILLVTLWWRNMMTQHNVCFNSKIMNVFKR